MKITNQIVAETAEHASKYLSDHLPSEFCYHDFFHTFSVVNAVDMLCKAIGVNKQDARILLVAAWFHDTGYAEQTEGHEITGALLAEEFLLNKNIDETEIAQVKACILATKHPVAPAGILEQILCDADMLHLSEPNFMERSNLLRQEWSATRNNNFTDKEWLQLNIDFLNAHTFHTVYCRQQFEKSKRRNLKKLEKQLLEIVPIVSAEDEEITIGNEETGVDIVVAKKEKKKKKPELERGVETLFRMTSGNHMKLSAMADDKAHILLNINSIIISVVLSLLVKNLSEMPYLILPTVILLSVCLVTIVFAVLTTKPKISKGVFTIEQIQNRQANLLFFGNFHKMGYESYEWGVQEIMYDKEYLYRSMTKDIYFLGKVLATKYRYLNIGYKVFMFGLIASVLAFAFSFFIAHHTIAL